MDRITILKDSQNIDSNPDVHTFHADEDLWDSAEELAEEINEKLMD